MRTKRKMGTKKKKRKEKVKTDGSQVSHNDPREPARALWVVHGLEPRPHFHEKTPRERRKNEICGGREERNFGRSSGGGQNTTQHTNTNTITNKTHRHTHIGLSRTGPSRASSLPPLPPRFANFGSLTSGVRGRPVLTRDSTPIVDDFEDGHQPQTPSPPPSSRPEHP